MRTHSKHRYRNRKQHSTHKSPHRQGQPQHRDRAPKEYGPPREVTGVLEVLPTGIGFLRRIDNDLMPSPEDAFISAAIIREKELRTGMAIKAMAGDRHAVTDLLEINGTGPQERRDVVPFDRQISIDPNERFTL